MITAKSEVRSQKDEVQTEAGGNPSSFALYPWKDIDAVVREQAEADIWSDEEHDAWLTGILADDDRSLTGSDPAYERWVEAGAPGVVWSLLDDAAVVAGVLPDWQRDEHIGM